MATLKCNSCEGEISSSARRVQCPHCGALFPFACAQCNRNLRPPFSVFTDERYLTLDDPPQPLCDEHYLRKCPDCDDWFGAHENPGYFRCSSCAAIHEAKLSQPRELEPEPLAPHAMPSTPMGEAGGVATKTRPSGMVAASGGGFGSNTMVLAFAACAFLALIGWFLLGRG